MSSIINIGGLAVGLATCILIMTWIQQVYGYDKFHRNIKDTYLLMKHIKTEGEISTSKAVPVPLAASLRNKIPEIKNAARLSFPGQQLIKAGDKLFYEQGFYAEPDFFNIMSFESLEGNPAEALQDAGSVVLTESTARKLFGNETAIGKFIIHNTIHNLKVGAVVKDIPDNSSIHFDMVLPFMLFEQDNSSSLDSWQNSNIQTWIQTVPAADHIVLNNKLEKLFRAQVGDGQTLFAYPFANLQLRGDFKNGQEEGGLIKAVLVITIIGIFILLIACVNFMNLATARSERRAREVGVRKVMGASRKLIIVQFLGEALFMSFLALVLGILLAKLSLPLINRLPDMNLSLDFMNWKLWIGLIILTAITGLVAGSYPAFFLSSFKPVRVLKGVVFTGSNGSSLRKGLVTFQFTISTFLIITTIVFFRQQESVFNRPIGYDADNLIDIPVQGNLQNKFDIVRTELSGIPGIQSVTASTSNLIFFGGFITGLQWPGKTRDQNLQIATTTVQYDWIKTAGLTLVDGRDFSPSYGTDSLACLINQAAVQRMGLKGPVIGTRLGDKTVIGVIKDFVYNGPATFPKPMVVYLGKTGMNHFFVRLKNDEHWQKNIAEVGKIIKRNNPDYPFEYSFTKEEYQKELRGLRAAVTLTTGIGIMAIFISCLGLFGLSAFLVERRTKEIGIRKVMGAGVAGIWFMLSRNFLQPVFIAFLVASPLAGFVLQKALSNTEYRIDLSWWMFAVAGLVSFIIAIITVSVEGVKAATANPVKSLRGE